MPANVCTAYFCFKKTGSVMSNIHAQVRMDSFPGSGNKLKTDIIICWAILRLKAQPQARAGA